MVTRQLPLTGLELRDQGIASLERHRWVDDARLYARAFCRNNGALGGVPFVTSDDVYDMMGPPPHPNCFGAIFHDKRFVATGERFRSKRPEAHGRWIMVWRLR